MYNIDNQYQNHIKINMPTGYTDIHTYIYVQTCLSPSEDMYAHVLFCEKNKPIRTIHSAFDAFVIKDLIYDKKYFNYCKLF